MLDGAAPLPPPPMLTGVAAGRRCAIATPGRGAIAGTGAARRAAARRGRDALIRATTATVFRAAVPGRHGQCAAARCSRIDATCAADNAIDRRERGAALLTVLLLVAVIAVLAAPRWKSCGLSTRLGGERRGDRAGARLGRSRRRRMALIADRRPAARSSPTRVTLAGGWSDTAVRAADARRRRDRARHRRRQLLQPQQPGRRRSAPAPMPRDTPARSQFARLMRLIGVPAQVARAIAAATADWIDTDRRQHRRRRGGRAY